MKVDQFFFLILYFIQGLNQKVMKQQKISISNKRGPFTSL